MIEYAQFKGIDGIVLRNRYRRAIFNTVLLTIANTLVISMIFSQILEIRKIQTFATTSDGRVIEIFAD